MCETARAQSELFAFQLGRYKEMSPGESYI